MNTLFVISSLSNSAPVKILLDIVSYFVERKNIHVSIITLHNEKEGSLYEKFKILGINIICLDVSKVYCELFSKIISKKIVKFVKENNINLLHASCYNSTIICSEIRCINKSLTFHNYYQEDYILSKGKILGSYMAKRFIHSAKKFEIPIAISKSMQMFYEEKLSKDVFLIYNGIDTGKYKVASESERNNIRCKLGLPLNKKIYIVSGVLIERKNPFTIIQSFLKAKLKNSVLLYIGDGPLRERANLMANENVIFQGFVTNPEDYLRAADFLISAAYSEGLPLNVIESISCGLPLILSNIPPHKEIAQIMPNDIIYLFEPEDVNALKFSIIDINHINYLNYAKKLHSIAVNNFSKEIMSKKYMEIFLANYGTKIY